MSNQPQQFEHALTMSAPDAVRRHFKWWADRMERRMEGDARRRKGYDVGEAKEPWNRAQFLSHLWKIAPDYPHEGSGERIAL
jgi:hypothetical protein